MTFKSFIRRLRLIWRFCFYIISMEENGFRGLYAVKTFHYWPQKQTNYVRLTERSIKEAEKLIVESELEEMGFKWEE